MRAKALGGGVSSPATQPVRAGLGWEQKALPVLSAYFCPW